MAKEDLKKLIKQRPDGSSHEELGLGLAFDVMARKGLDSEVGRTISYEDVGRRIRSW